jgi:hypothetical protein
MLTRDVINKEGILQLCGNKIHMNNFNVNFLTDVIAGVWRGAL